MAMRIVDNTSEHWCAWSGLGSLTVPVFVRAYLWLSATPVTQRYYFLKGFTAAVSTAWHFRIFTGSPVMSAADATVSGFGAEGSTAVNIGSWFRIEARIVASATVGEFQWKLFNSPDSTTATETSANFTGLNLGANTDMIRWGSNTLFPASPFTVYFDDIAVSTTDWIGPTATSQIILPDADTTTTGWTSTPLWSKVNDASDATVITSTAS